MQARPSGPDPPLPEDREIIHFESEEEFRAWARENVADWESFVNNSLASIAAIRAWREAGNAGFPPGYVRFRDYVREHPV